MYMEEQASYKKTEKTTKKTVALTPRPKGRTRTGDNKKMSEDIFANNSRSLGPISAIIRKYLHDLGRKKGIKKISDIPRMTDEDATYFIRSQGHTYECYYPLFDIHKRRKPIHYGLPILERLVKEIVKSEGNEHNDKRTLTSQELEILENLIYDEKKSKKIKKILDAREEYRFRKREVKVTDKNGNPVIDKATGEQKIAMKSPLKSEPLGYATIDRENAYRRFFFEKDFADLEFVKHFHVEPSIYPYIGREIGLMIFGRYLFVQVDSCDGQHLLEYYIIPLRDEFLDSTCWKIIPMINLSSRKHVKKDVAKFDRVVQRVAGLAPTITRKMEYYGNLLNELEGNGELNDQEFGAIKERLFHKFLKLILDDDDSPSQYYNAFFKNSLYQTNNYTYWLYMLLSTLRVGRVVGVKYKEIKKDEKKTLAEKEERTLLFGREFSLKMTKSCTTEEQVDELQNGMFTILEDELGKIPGLKEFASEEEE